MLVVIDGKIYKVTKEYNNGDLRLKYIDAKLAKVVDSESIITAEQEAEMMRFNDIFDKSVEELSKYHETAEDNMWIKEPHQK